MFIDLFTFGIEKPPPRLGWFNLIVCDLTLAGTEVLESVSIRSESSSHIIYTSVYIYIFTTVCAFILSIMQFMYPIALRATTAPGPGM